jgi:GNAT superfamily N-acetyltransferase
MIGVRAVEAADLAPLAELWIDGWHEAHDAISSPELMRLRTDQSFHDRIVAFGDEVRCTGPMGAPTGLCVVKDDQLHQIFTSPAVRGTGVAQALIADAEARVRAAGHEKIWLDAAIGNDRARRFYEKMGWFMRGEEIVDLETQNGPLPTRLWVFEKVVG